jgi:hypothetical protein
MPRPQTSGIPSARAREVKVKKVATPATKPASLLARLDCLKKMGTV